MLVRLTGESFYSLLDVMIDYWCPHCKPQTEIQKEFSEEGTLAEVIIWGF